MLLLCCRYEPSATPAAAENKRKPYPSSAKQSFMMYLVYSTWYEYCQYIHTNIKYGWGFYQYLCDTHTHYNPTNGEYIGGQRVQIMWSTVYTEEA